MFLPSFPSPLRRSKETTTTAPPVQEETEPKQRYCRDSLAMSECFRLNNIGSVLHHSLQNCLRAGWGYLPWRAKTAEALTLHLSTLSGINLEMSTPIFLFLIWVSPFVLDVYTPSTVNGDLLNIIHGAGRFTHLTSLEVFI